MKTIEEKAKSYDEALKVLHKYDGANIMFTQDLKEEMFPELKESEDERIRRVIRGWIYTRPASFFDNGISKEEMLAWLEKQGEQKPADKIEPKFEIKEGKLYVCIRDLLDNYANKAFCKGDIYLSTQNGSLIPSNSNVPFKVVCPDTYFKDWTIQDAKDGDVLTYKDSRNNVWVCIFKEYANERVYDYCTLDKESFYEHGNWNYLASFSYTPATKEQRAALIKAMADAGYTFDFEKKELKKIEQNSAWSEEDELHIRELESLVKQVWAKAERENDKDTIHEMSDLSFFLKTLKPQPQQEWNKEDNEMINAIRTFIACGNTGDISTSKGKMIIWLKSLKDRYAWRPTKEQLRELRCVISGCSFETPILVQLEEDLKKLL